MTVREWIPTGVYPRGIEGGNDIRKPCNKSRRNIEFKNKTILFNARKGDPHVSKGLYVEKSDYD